MEGTQDCIRRVQFLPEWEDTERFQSWLYKTVYEMDPRTYVRMRQLRKSNIICSEYLLKF